MAASSSPAPDDFALAKDGDTNGDAQMTDANAQGEHVLAADYDPSHDRREDEHKRFGVPHPQQAAEVVESEEFEEVEEVEEDDIDDMFAVDKPEKKVKKVRRKVTVRSSYTFVLHTLTSRQKPAAPALITTTLDSASDPEGYYTIVLGEQLDNGMYQVFSSLGKGMFANVVRARILQGPDTGREVAIKLVRSQESMYVQPAQIYVLFMLLQASCWSEGGTDSDEAQSGRSGGQEAYRQARADLRASRSSLPRL